MTDPDPPPVQVDERFIPEWVEQGLILFGQLLTRHAKFDAWCEEHGRKEEAA